MAFCAVTPKRSKHMVKVTNHRKAKDFAKALGEIHREYPNAKKIDSVMDYLNTHSPWRHILGQSVVGNYGQDLKFFYSQARQQGRD